MSALKVTWHNYEYDYHYYLIGTSADKIWKIHTLCIFLLGNCLWQPESKREEFRRYLEKSGVMDSLTRVLVSLYEEPERPNNAIDYFLDRLAAGLPLKAEMESAVAELTDLRNKVWYIQKKDWSRWICAFYWEFWDRNWWKEYVYYLVGSFFRQISSLEAENEALRRRLEQYEPTSANEEEAAAEE
jgi:hypothetical protein